MARGADEPAWRQARAICDAVVGSIGGGELRPEFCNPYWRKPQSPVLGEKLQASRWKALEEIAEFQGWGTVVTGPINAA